MSSRQMVSTRLAGTSTPTIHGVSRIEREYEVSDQRCYFVPCPHCGHEQALRFERLRWEKSRPETAHYACEACERSIEERHKTAMMVAGRWQAAATPADPGTIGFHLSALYSPVGWLSWTGIARMWEAAQATDEAKRSFQNSVLGETWIETGEAPDWQRLYERREAWRIGTVPSGGLFLTAGADVQKDRIEVSIWAWGRGQTSWLIEHIVIDGGPERQASWGELTSLLGRTWPHAHGARLGIAKLAVDTGYQAPAVYAWARGAGFAQVAPVKGVEGFNRAAPVAGPSFVDATERGRKIRRGARLWTIAVATFKSETYRRLRPVSLLPERKRQFAKPPLDPVRLDIRKVLTVATRRALVGAATDEDIAAGATDPPGFIHLPRGAEAEWIKQLVAEQLVTVTTRRGFQKLEWQKLRERNEVLDCRVYARAAAWIAGADRWSGAKWRDLGGPARACARPNRWPSRRG